MNHEQNRPTELTHIGSDSLYDIGQTMKNEPDDRKKIYRILQSIENTKEGHESTFGQYLMRRIRVKAGNEALTQEACIDILYDSLVRNGIPSHLPSPDGSYEKADKRTVRGWFSKCPMRALGAPILVGFSLDLSLAEVNELYRKGLGETELHSKRGYECIALFCFNNHLDFEYYRRVLIEYAAELAGIRPSQEINLELSSGLHDELLNLKEKSELMRFLREHRVGFDLKTDPSVTARDIACRLFDEIAEQAKYCMPYEFSCQDSSAFSVGQIERLLYGSNPMDQYGMLFYPDQYLQEAFLYAVPTDESGNLLFRDRVLADNKEFHFNFSPLTRQALSKILEEKTASTTPRNTPRECLITLCFLKWALATSDEYDTQYLEWQFENEADEVLVSAGFEPLRAANPFDCFMMSIAAEEEGHNPLMLHHLAWSVTVDEYRDYCKAVAAEQAAAEQTDS